MSSARTRVATLSVLLVAVGMAALLAPAAEATVYTVTMKNGTTFDTRYQPEEASWDPDRACHQYHRRGKERAVAFPALEKEVLNGIDPCRGCLGEEVVFGPVLNR